MMAATVLPDSDEFATSTPKVRGDALVRHYGNEIVAWSPDAPWPLHLDPVTALVFQLLDGTATVAELVADVHEIIGIPQAIARNQIGRSVSTFDGAALLTSSQAQVVTSDDIDIFAAPPNP